MIVRIVRMTFHADAVEDFLVLFDAAAPNIRAFDGCRHLELWREAGLAHVMTSYSHWTQPEALERYRQSVLFKETWSKAKPLFGARPVATSWHVLRTVQP